MKKHIIAFTAIVLILSYSTEVYALYSETSTDIETVTNVEETRVQTTTASDSELDINIEEIQPLDLRVETIAGLDTAQEEIEVEESEASPEAQAKVKSENSIKTETQKRGFWANIWFKIKSFFGIRS